MATVEDFKVKVSVDGANKLNQLGDGANKAASAISGLAAGILGVGFGAFIQGALKSADAMVDLSDATGLTVASVKAFGESMRLAGGDSKGAERAIMTLFSSIEAAADGSQKAQESFGKVGVSIKDLETLSEADILQKTIEGLAKIPAGSERAAAATALLGRTFRGVEAEKFLETLDPAKYAEFEESAKKAADTVERFENIFASLQQGALQALDPILGLLEDLNFSAKDAERMFQLLAVAMAGVFAVKTIGMIMDMVKAVKVLTTALRGTVIAQTALTALSGPKGWALIAGGVLASAAAYVALDKAIGDANETAAESPITPGPNKLQSTASASGPVNRKIKANPEVEAAQKAAAESEKRILQSQAEYRKLTETSATDAIQNIRVASLAEIQKMETEVLANKLLTTTQKEKEIAQRRLEIAKKAEVDIAKLRSDAEVALTEQLRTIQTANKDRQEQFELERKILGMSGAAAEVERQRFEIEKQRKQALLEIDKIKNADPAKLKAARDAANAEYNEQLKTAEQQIEFQRQFETGWSKAFQSYMDNATNAATQAQAMFQAMTNGMNSALDAFVDTGKFSFSDLTNSIIKDIIKIQLRAAAARLFSAGSNFLGFSVPGRAVGGPVMANTPYMIGERGPELFIPAQAGNIMANDKLNKLGGGAAPMNITYNIQAVDAMSFKQMVARDPSFLYAVTEQGRKTIPSTRR
jgi:lambda family phage tail tape measure protein